MYLRNWSFSSACNIAGVASHIKKLTDWSLSWRWCWEQDFPAVQWIHSVLEAVCLYSWTCFGGSRMTQSYFAIGWRSPRKNPLWTLPSSVMSPLKARFLDAKKNIISNNLSNKPAFFPHLRLEFLLDLAVNMMYQGKMQIVPLVVAVFMWDAIFMLW